MSECKHPYESCVWMSNDDETIWCQDCDATGIKPSGFYVLDGLANERDTLRARVAELELLNEAYRERISPAISCPIDEFLGPVKPCPFCGSEGINLYEDQVECGNCRATAEPGPWQFRDTRKLEAAEARIRELEAALKEAHAELGLGEQTDIQTRLHERIRELEAALATTNELLATAKISSSEAALRWGWRYGTADAVWDLFRDEDEYIQRGLKAVCGEGEK